MFPADLSTVNEAYLVTMCTERRPESQTLDFKRALPAAGSPAWREEVAKDICAFANADGGDIVYGIADRDARAESVAAIAGERQDAAMRRLREAADDLVQPRVIGLSCEPFAVGGGYVLVLRVPQSFNGPHGFVINGDVLRFPIRVGTGTAEMNYEQLRTAFDRTASLRERARAFRMERVNAVLAGNPWRQMSGPSLLGVQFVPLQAVTGADMIDVTALRKDYHRFALEGWRDVSATLHLDGLSVYVPGTNQTAPLPACNLIYRSGAMEAIRSVGRELEGRSIIAGVHVARLIREAVIRFLEQARVLGLSGPGIMGVVLSNVWARSFMVDQWEGAVPDRQHLILPETWVERIEAVDPETVWRPIVDLLWQCYGLERCTAFDGEPVRR